MTNRLNIAMAQLNQRVGDLAGNAGKMLEWRAKATDADLIVFPEQQLIGYPAEDLVLKPAFAARAAVELAKLAEATADGGPAMLVGSIFLDDGALYNGIALLDTELLMKSGSLHLAPCRNLWCLRACVLAFRFAKMAGSPRLASI